MFEHYRSTQNLHELRKFYGRRSLCELRVAVWQKDSAVSPRRHGVRREERVKTLSYNKLNPLRPLRSLRQILLFVLFGWGFCRARFFAVASLATSKICAPVAVDQIPNRASLNKNYHPDSSQLCDSLRCRFSSTGIAVPNSSRWPKRNLFAQLPWHRVCAIFLVSAFGVDTRCSVFPSLPPSRFLHCSKPGKAEGSF